MARYGQFAAILLGLVATTGVFGQCQYDVTIIQGPTHPVYGPAATVATGLNNLGHVVGYYFYAGGDDRGFVWSAEHGLLTLPTPPGAAYFRANSISDGSLIVGTADVPNLGGFRGFAFDGTDLLYLPPVSGGNYSYGLAANASGQIVGYWGDSVTGSPSTQGYIFQNGTILDLSTDLDSPEAVAHAINDHGQVAGWRGTASFSDATAFVWRDGQVIGLPPIAGGITSEARGINESGSVAGFGWTSNPTLGTGFRRAFAWLNGQMTPIAALPGFSHALALAINDSNTVVGYCTGSTQRAFVWQSFSTFDLTALLRPESGVIAKFAASINESGEIAGYGTHDGSAVGLLLRPIRILGDLDRDCDVGLSDLSTLLADFGCVGECAGDLTDDGVTSISDLAVLLSNFGQ